MAHWIDLSAHNLALWRIGEDVDGHRRYLLSPISSRESHTPIAADSIIAQRFSWDEAEQGYVYDMDLKNSRLPAFNDWLEAFPAAVIRDRDTVTYPIHQKDALEVHVLFLANPWVWSNHEKPHRFFANEEQALADDVGGSVLRSAEEVDMRGIQPVLSPVDNNALEKLQNYDVTPAENLEPEDAAESAFNDSNNEPSSEQGLSSDDNSSESLPAESLPVESLSESGFSSDGTNSDEGKRVDYGEYIPGARKNQYEKWASDLENIRELIAKGQMDNKSIKDLAGKTKRDLILGTLEEKLEKCEKSLWKKTLWGTIYRVIPASVRSVPFKGRRGEMDDETLMYRILSYTQLLQAVDRKMESLPDNPTGPDIMKAIYGNPFLTRPKEINDTIPMYNYSTNDEEIRSLMSGNTEKYDDYINHPALGLSYLLHGFTKRSENALRDVLFSDLAQRSNIGEPEYKSYIEKYLQEILPTYRHLTIKDNAERFKEFGRPRVASMMPARFFEGRHEWADGKTQPAPAELVEYVQALSDDAYESLKNECAEYQADYSIEKIKECFENSYRLGFLEGLLRFYPQYTNYLGNEVIPDEEAKDRMMASVMVMDVVAKTIVNVQESMENMAKKSESALSGQKEPEYISWSLRKNALPPETGKEDGYRSGPYHLRGDRDVDEKELCETFGFRGVQYGNWMSQQDRQEHLNAAFDSCADIQHLFNLPEAQMVSLPRRTASNDRQPLALALGARGVGRAKAHYEPDLHVFNMTKKRGAGSMLHEWTHALDAFYGAEITDGMMVMASDLSASGRTNVLRNFVDALKKEPAYIDKDDSPVEKMKKEAIQYREAHRKMSDKLAQTFLSTDMQSTVFWELKNKIELQMAKKILEKDGLKFGEVDYNTFKNIRLTVSDDAFDAAKETFEKYISTMIKNFNADLGKVESSLDMEDDGQGGMQFKGSIERTATDIFALSFYHYTSSNRMNYDTIRGETKIREWMGLPKLPEKFFSESQEERLQARDDREKETNLPYSDMMAMVWEDNIRGSLWKKVINPLVNRKNPYADIRRQSFNVKKNSSFYENAIKLGEYWKREHELVARAVACTGFDILKEDGITNTYLTDRVPLLFSDTEKWRGDPDPQGMERENSNHFFMENVIPALKDKLSAALQEMAENAQTAYAGAENQSESDDGQYPQFMHERAANLS